MNKEGNSQKMVSPAKKLHPILSLKRFGWPWETCRDLFLQCEIEPGIQAVKMGFNHHDKPGPSMTLWQRGAMELNGDPDHIQEPGL